MFYVIYTSDTQELLHWKLDTSAGMPLPTADEYKRQYCKDLKIQNDSVGIYTAESIDVDVLTTFICNQCLFDPTTGTVSPNPNYVPPEPVVEESQEPQQ